MTLHIVSISGSLRAASSNAALLDAAALLAPSDMVIDRYADLGRLPHFNPDLAISPPKIVMELDASVEKADGLLICCPEYARGIPGSFKNMLDWLVGSTTFPGKPVALFNASPRASVAQDALRLVLTTMSARLIEEASITLPLIGGGLDAAAIVGDPALSSQISEALAVFSATIRQAGKGS